MPAPRVDHNGGHGTDRDAFAVEFHFSGAFEDDINFGHPFMVVSLGVGFDVDLVNTGDGVFGVDEATAGSAARTREWRQIIELGDQIILRCRHGA